jgi:hypothetical protein
MAPSKEKMELTTPILHDLHAVMQSSFDGSAYSTFFFSLQYNIIIMDIDRYPDLATQMSARVGSIAN